MQDYEHRIRDILESGIPPAERESARRLVEVFSLETTNVGMTYSGADSYLPPLMRKMSDLLGGEITLERVAPIHSQSQARTLTFAALIPPDSRKELLDRIERLDPERNEFTSRDPASITNDHMRAFYRPLQPELLGWQSAYIEPALAELAKMQRQPDTYHVFLAEPIQQAVQNLPPTDTSQPPVPGQPPASKPWISAFLKEMIHPENVWKVVSGIVIIVVAAALVYFLGLKDSSSHDTPTTTTLTTTAPTLPPPSRSPATDSPRLTTAPSQTSR